MRVTIDFDERDCSSATGRPIAGRESNGGQISGIWLHDVPPDRTGKDGPYKIRGQDQVVAPVGLHRRSVLRNAEKVSTSEQVLALVGSPRRCFLQVCATVLQFPCLSVVVNKWLLLV